MESLDYVLDLDSVDGDDVWREDVFGISRGRSDSLV